MNQMLCACCMYNALFKHRKYAFVKGMADRLPDEGIISFEHLFFKSESETPLRDAASAELMADAV